MIRVTTKHGSKYLIDRKNRLAMRINESGNSMVGDSNWFMFSHISAWDWDARKILDEDIQVGKGIYFTLVGHPEYDWRISTEIVSIEEYDGQDNI